MASGAEELLSAFSRWAADERVALAAAERSRIRSLRVQSAKSATWVGLLVDLAERSAVVSVTAGGTRLTGCLVGVGRDFFVLEPAAGRPVLVATQSATSVSAAPEEPASSRAGGDRRPALDLSLLSAFDALAEERSPVAVCAGGTTFEGELLSVGEDVITLRTMTAQRRTVHLPAASVAWCELR